VSREGTRAKRSWCGIVSFNKSVQLHASANNVTLLAFAADYRAAAPSPAVAVDRCRLAAGHTTASPTHTAAVVDRRDRQTDERTPYRYIQPVAYYASSVSKINVIKTGAHMSAWMWMAVHSTVDAPTQQASICCECDIGRVNRRASTRQVMLYHLQISRCNGDQKVIR